MTARPIRFNLLIRARDFFASLLGARRRYRPERHYLRGKPSGFANQRRPPV